MNRFCFLLVAGLLTSCTFERQREDPPSAAIHKPSGASPAVSLFVDQNPDFPGLTLEAPNTVHLSEMIQGQFIWEREPRPAERTYSGTLHISGIFSVFVPEGKQEEIWRDLSDKINFVVKDLKTGQVQHRRRVQGGWHLARLGISVTMAEPPVSDFDYSTMPSEVIHSQTFSIEVFDDLPIMPEPDTVLEIHVEYMGFVSDPVRVNAVLKPE